MALVNGNAFPDGSLLMFSLHDDIKDVYKEGDDGTESPLTEHDWKLQILPRNSTLCWVIRMSSGAQLTKSVRFRSRVTVKQFVHAVLTFSKRKITRHEKCMAEDDRPCNTYGDLLGDHVFYEGVNRQRGSFVVQLGS